jgi:hypothetical protein
LSDGLELRRHVRVAPDAGGNDPSVLAVRAVELLRDIYLDIPRITRQPEPAAPAAAKSPPPAGAAGAPSSQVSGRAFVAAGALNGRRGLGTAVGPVFGFGISWASRLTLLGSVSGPFQQTLHIPSSGMDMPAAIDVSQTLAALDLRYEIGPFRIRPYATAGVGLYAKHVEVATQGTPPVTPPVTVLGSPSALAPLIAVGVGVIARIFPWLAVSLDFQEVAVLPTQDVTVQEAGGPAVIGRAGPSDLVELGIVLCPP